MPKAPRSEPRRRRRRGEWEMGNGEGVFFPGGNGFYYFPSVTECLSFRCLSYIEVLSEYILIKMHIIYSSLKLSKRLGCLEERRVGSSPSGSGGGPRPKTDFRDFQVTKECFSLRCLR